MLIEEYIQGDELTVGIVGNNPPTVLGTLHVLPQQKEERFIYSLEVKRDWQRRVRYECPPKLPPGRVKAVEDAALRAYNALGCRDVARIDFRLRDGVPYFIEANPLPGLNPQTGDLVILAGKVGVSHAQLIERILSAALERQKR
jgi:D-alanine-D-alanine ligase